MPKRRVIEITGKVRFPSNGTRKLGTTFCRRFQKVDWMRMASIAFMVDIQSMALVCSSTSGETKRSEKSARVFKTRLREHFKGRFWNQTGLQVYLGTTERALSASEVELVESILIAAHAPALNRRHLDAARKESRGFHIMNYGFIGSLITECSGDYWAPDT